MLPPLWWRSMADHRTGNFLLDGLAANELQHLLPRLTKTSLVQKQSLNMPGEVIEQVYFPTSAVASIIATPDEGAAVEVGVIGREGLIGTPILLGSETASNEAYVQIAGTALQIPPAPYSTPLSRAGACAGGCCASRRPSVSKSRKAPPATPGM